MQVASREKRKQQLSGRSIDVFDALRGKGKNCQGCRKRSTPFTVKHPPSDVATMTAKEIAAGSGHYRATDLLLDLNDSNKCW